jgi:hypothetical protein
LTRSMWPSMAIWVAKIFVNFSFWKNLFSAAFELVQSLHFTFTLFQFWKIIVNILYGNFKTFSCCCRRSVMLYEFCAKCFSFRYSNVHHHRQFSKSDFILQIRNKPQILVGFPETKRILGRNVWRLDDSVNTNHIGIRC